VLGHDIAPDPAFGEAQGLRWTDPETLFKESDIVTLHVPLTRETRHMVGARELAWMKADALLINTARGGVVDEASLAKALNEGTLQGAALDVFENEPYDGPLLKMENCLLSCHMAAASPDSSRAMELGAAEEIVRFLAGEPLQGLVGEEEYRRQADSD
jgi:D-3-phosphoglycerate dehydrogenase